MTTTHEPEPAPPRPKSSALIAARGALVLAMVVAVGLTIWGIALLVRPPQTPRAEIPVMDLTPADVPPGAVVPADVAQPAPEGATSQDVLGEWAERVAANIDVPARALRAYALTDVLLRSEMPRCRLSWATLAGIGRVESNHGRFAGASLDQDGRPSRPIIGIPLDGSPGVREIPDTDGGSLDGDPVHDRAVGPMQFIPTTWARWGSDGDGDNRADPHDLDDAALAAGRYLCADGRDTMTPAGWWGAVLAYNNSVEYGRVVFGVADTYARSTRP